MTATRVRTMCPMNCHPTYCGMVAAVEDGRLLGVHGDPENPDSRGFLCVRGRATVEIFDNPARVLVPRVRDVRAGGSWHDTTWDAALDRIAAAIREAGPDRTAVYTGHGIGHNGIGSRFGARFAHMAGLQWWNPSIVCWGLGGFGFALTGVTEVNTMDDLAANAEFVLLWGANIAAQPNTAPRLVAARKRGARIITIDVRHTEAFALADETIVIRPGTDAALALAMMHVIIGEGLHDAAYVADHTVGFEDLVAHVRQYPPEWAENETGVPAATIRTLARRFAGTRRSMILAGGSSMHKSGNGWHAARAIACLPALTGALGTPGAGMGPRHAAQCAGMGFGSIVPPRAPGSLPDEVISEMSGILDALDAGRIRVLLLLGTDMLSNFADAGRVSRALARMDLVVAHDLFENATIRAHAGVVLPATAWLEETGFKASNTNLVLMERAVAPAGECRPSWAVMDALARRLGVDGFFPWASVEGAIDAMLDHDATGHATVAALRAAGGMMPLHVSAVGHPAHIFPTPSGRVEFRSQRAADLGLPSLPVYERARETHPTATAAARFPLAFVQGRAITHFHGFYDHGRALPSLAKVDPGPRLWMNPVDASVRGLVDGTAVRLFNDRGEMAAVAHVTERVPAGVVWMHDGWEGINRLTSGARSVPDAAAAGFPAGSAAYEARVDVAAVAPAPASAPVEPAAAAVGRRPLNAE